MKRLPKDSLTRMCTGKRRYATQGDALDAAAILGLERMREAYRCQVCGKWHLTSKPANR